MSGKNPTLWGKLSQISSFSRFKMRWLRPLDYRLPASIHPFTMLASRSDFLAPKSDNQLIKNIKIHSIPSPNSIFDSASQLSSKLNSNDGKREMFIYEWFNFPKTIFSEQFLPLIEVLYHLVCTLNILFKSAFWTSLPSSWSTYNSV